MSALSVVTGAGGFIGGHMVRALVDRGVAVRAADSKPLGRWYQRGARPTSGSTPR